MSKDWSEVSFPSVSKAFPVTGICFGTGMNKSQKLDRASGSTGRLIFWALPLAFLRFLPSPFWSRSSKARTPRRPVRRSPKGKTCYYFTFSTYPQMSVRSAHDQPHKPTQASSSSLQRSMRLRARFRYSGVSWTARFRDPTPASIDHREGIACKSLIYIGGV